MKKAFTVLIFGITLTGAGCVSSESPAPQVLSETPVPRAEAVSDVQESDKAEVETFTALTDGEIGFTVTPPEGWGGFSVVLYKRSLPAVPALGEDWEYRGTFSDRADIIYRATDPDHVVARGGYAGDVLGYEKRADGFYIRVGNSETASKVPEALIVGEVPLVNGTALLLQGPEVSDGPSPFPNSPGELVAYVNTPNGPLAGGVFMTNWEGSNVTIEEMKALLATVLVK